MFGNDPQSMKLTLLEMARSANDATLGKGVAPDETLQGYIKSDARFQGFAPERLATEVLNRARNGQSQSIDLDDPYLQGGQQRPSAKGSGRY